ncbi:50S ribosome-binding GTPase [Paraburkholderia sp. MMS20-SJTR3]|uniref:50S ribosome-binding GTPase n=1 Tax=Paraburkholderia sejongensis TaxID=2886946 RepID=A0ABS8JZ17_9BURK|nr:dynamin family protein [Paraburkholderia sp. MMS20-SJTR3]MCC8395152.1 50S ribosome-binding GTPase [Paraburkholderia sp. MMS20-SJTR3]
MKADASVEQRFIAEVDAFDFVAQDIDAQLHALNDWLVKLDADLQATRFCPDGLHAHHALTVQVDALDALLRDSVPAWTQQWADHQETQALADRFDDEALLLVFGKFNAGKSSFCNFLAERFAAHGRAVQYFHVDAGWVVETCEPFKEGSTETTSRLQGVRLGNKLVLLDTPGLHSVTPENAALTQRFTDSADGVLWLTSSTSPGQVQELDELGRELHRNKPLLPVVTRSDEYDEDEIDGELVKCLCNKSPQRRALQEQDILTRAQEKLVAMSVEAGLLKAPVSISAYVARVEGQTPDALHDAGFERLYAALLAITEPALAYKRRKRAEILLHHLEENVLGYLQRDAVPLLAALNGAARSALALLEQRQEQLANAVWRGIVPTLPGLLDAHATAHDVKGLCNTLSQAIAERFSGDAQKLLGDYVVVPDGSLARIELDAHVDFEDVVAQRVREDGRPSEIAGVDYTRVHAALTDAIRDCVLRLAADAAQQCRASITRVMKRAERLDEVLAQHEERLLALKSKLRSESI